MISFFKAALVGAALAQKNLIKALENSLGQSADRILRKDTTPAPFADHTNRYGF